VLCLSKSSGLRKQKITVGKPESKCSGKGGSGAIWPVDRIRSRAFLGRTVLWKKEKAARVCRLFLRILNRSLFERGL